MSSDPRSDKPPEPPEGTDGGEKPTSMQRADVANGESPDPVADDERREGHATGQQQAQQNKENDPPA